MKKIVAILLALTMILALGACGGKAPTTDPTDAPDTADTLAGAAVSSACSLNAPAGRRITAARMAAAARMILEYAYLLISISPP